MLREVVVMMLMLGGAFFMALAGLGLLRMPDLFLRMSSTSKAGTLGSGLLLLGAAIHFDNFSISTRAIAIIVFLLLTTPVAAHMIGRAAYFDGVPLWKGTIQDDLHGRYRLSTHSLETSVIQEGDSPATDEDAIADNSEFDR